jgi:hypothetical protein
MMWCGGHTRSGIIQIIACDNYYDGYNYKKKFHEKKGGPNSLYFEKKKSFQIARFFMIIATKQPRI